MQVITSLFSEMKNVNYYEGSLANRCNADCPTAHWSDYPLVRKPISPTAHWSENPLVRRPIGLKTLWTENPLVQKGVIGPKMAGRSFFGSFLLDR